MEVQINSYTRTLQGNLIRPEKPNAGSAILLIHGWTSAQDRMRETAEMLSEKLGAICLTVDLSGHGKTGGDLNVFSRKDFLDDIKAAYDFLISQEGVDPEKIGVVGSSFGSYLAALLTAHRRVSWVSLRAPADYPDEGFTEPQMGQPKDMKWREAPKNHTETAALRALNTFSGKVLIIESEFDELVPRQTLLNYKNAVSNPQNITYEIIKGASHSVTRHPELRKVLNDILFHWLKNF